MLNFQFDNRFVRQLPGDPEVSQRRRQVEGACWSRAEPTPVASPHLVAHAAEVAKLLAISDDDIHSQEFADVFAGNRVLPGMQPYAAAYGGHQFGHWAGQLGDGRAINLGEVINTAGERWELQLKGAGPTPYSRRADGRAVLRSSVREFLCSEAMFHLGVPTTRALSLVGTGDTVLRDMLYDGNPRHEPGAVVCRVAPSFIRFGHFELPSSRGDTALLETLVDFCIDRDFPELTGSPVERRIAWFHAICERTAVMVAHWMRVGFVHGVMNTDNMSILGLTIDYGPYGWIDDFDPDWTPNTTDAEGRRYRFGHQPQICHWNLARLAESLSSLFTPLFGSPEPLEAGLAHFIQTYGHAYTNMMAAKLGLPSFKPGDGDMLADLYALMHASEMDMTLFFRSLAELDINAPDPSLFSQHTYHPAMWERRAPSWQDWLNRYAARLQAENEPVETRRNRMNAVNPKFVLRNYLAQEAINLAEQGNFSRVNELLEVMRNPYDEQPGREAFAEKRPDWARHQPGCSMLSCSS
jgi:uncharacterized protein YdiU (UPF0061 family)